ncbi:mitochondrial ATPase expression-domain-containing protein [Xylariaceae sp. FL1651]|nr:mitochondrial ATPase expression-domain-containing protein [Xylariaceae sp. FL1651]
MLPNISVAENYGSRILQRAPRGTPSRILSLRLHRCFHHQKASRPSTPHLLSPSVSNHIDCYAGHARNQNGVAGFRRATTHSPAPLSQSAVVHVQSLLDRLSARTQPNTGSPDPPRTPNAHARDSLLTPLGVPGGVGSTNSDAGCVLMDPFRGALLAIQEGDTRKLLVRLGAIERMSQQDLEDAVATLPRTTFTEFFRALDPLCVARDCDPLEAHNVSVGMFKMLNMDSTIDEWGVRKLYTRLMRRLLMLMSALKASGHALLLEEYILLIRCAGAACDSQGAREIWHDLKLGPALAWRNSEAYTEFIMARFLTEPLYTNYRKTTRVVTPRNLHRTQMNLFAYRVWNLDRLSIATRKSKLRFGLNKDVELREGLMRMLRHRGPAVRLFEKLKRIGYPMDERLLCAIMVGLGRAGSLRLVGTMILQDYFGINLPYLTYDDVKFKPDVGVPNKNISFTLARIRPTVRLMRAIMETYGSNGEISLAMQLVEQVSSTYNIPVPSDVWQDLLEWTHIMGTPPMSTAWKIAGWHVKIPSPKAVEMIWNVMVSSPYNQVPTFKQYDVLIRSIIGRRSFNKAKVLLHMREAIALYHEQCREYEAAVFEYTQHLRDGVYMSATYHRFERARFKKQQMWYDISVWCRTLLSNFHYCINHTLPNPLVPDFVQEFRPFLKNPIQYSTPTGRVTLRDPATEDFRLVQNGHIELGIEMQDKKSRWTTFRLRQRRVKVLSSHSLASLKASKLSPLNLLAPQQNAFH